jgi:hypothetical protein
LSLALYPWRITLRILDGLNTRRTANDQISVWNERRHVGWWMKHFAIRGPLGFYRILVPEYRREFPESRAPRLLPRLTTTCAV